MNLSEWLDLKALGTTAVAFLPRLLVAAIILFLFWVAFRTSRAALRNIMLRARFEEALIDLLIDNIYRSALIVIAVVIAAGQVGINILPALAGLGVVGIALGFAAQDSVANMISGFLIFWDKPFRVGDYVSLQDQYGRVTEITLRTTRVRTPANSYVVIPNRKIIESTLVNHSKHGGMRIEVPVTIAGSESVADARRALLDGITGIEGVVDEPNPDVVVKALGTMGTDLLLRVWIDDAALERPVFYRVTEAAKEALERAGLETPSPQIQLLVDQAQTLLKPAPERRGSVQADAEDE
ncbi:MAG TPA: mechanosensitive ion channel [Candidatus Eisenbacteria bacterium]|nr:mechanosensitive ion channel [Candidatus Eisenbacteria bacterium]